MGNESITVSEFNSLLNQTLNFAYPEVVVEGEVSSYKINQSKWVFFDLKDEESVVSCFMTVYQLKSEIEDGMVVRVKATPQLTKWGKFSLTVKEIELAGEGSVKRAFELLKAKFEKEGLFLPERKRQLPEMPEKVLLITSKQAAAFNDFVSIIDDRWGGLEIDHIQVQVQGAVAAEQIVDAIEYANSCSEKYEVLVIIRGGGSSEDLQAFNNEELVRVVYGSSIPTIVGIGHEDDISLAELAADVRAATPTDAARRLVPDKKELVSKIKLIESTMLSSLVSLASNGRSLLDDFYHSMEIRINNLKHETAELQSLATTYIAKVVDNSSGQLKLQQKLLNSLNPSAILSRGYSIARVNGRIIKSSSQYKDGDSLVIQLHQGKIELKSNNTGDKKTYDQQAKLNF